MHTSTKRIHKIMLDPDRIRANGRMEVSVFPIQGDRRVYPHVTRSSMERLETLTYRYRVTAVIGRYPTIFIRNEGE